MATSVGSTNLTTSNTWQLLEAINPDPSQSSTMAVYTNGTLVTSGVTQSGTTAITAPLFINGQGGQISASNSVPAYLAELIVFNTGLSLSNRQMVEGYLAWKWGLQGNLPINHPYYSATPSAGVASAGNMNVDYLGNIQVAPTNNFRILAPTEWRTNMITVSGTSLTIPTPTTLLPSSYSAALYTLTNTGFNALTLPTYTSSSPGIFWELYNSTNTNLTISVTYTSGSGLGSSFTLNAGSSTNIYWSGSAFQAISGQGPTGPGFTTITTPGSNFVLTTASSTSSNAAVANSNLTFNGSTLAVTGNVTTTSTTSNSIGGSTLSNSILTVGAATTGSTTSGSVNVAGGYFVNGVQLSGGSAISTYSNAGAVLFAMGTSTGLQGSSNLFFSNSSNLGIQTTTPATALDVNGGVTIRNGLRPLYSNVSSGTSLTVAANSYGTNFNITTSSLTGITLPTVVWSNDSNGYWTFRNNTSGYLPITFTYTGSYTTAPTNPVTIPPANSVTIMVTYPSGSTSNYVLF